MAKFTEDSRLFPKYNCNGHLPKQEAVRTFDTGATRSPLGDKLQYEGFISPIVIKRFAEFMRRHQVQTDGNIRDADNWQKGIPVESLMDSWLRHVIDVWLHYRGYGTEAVETLNESLCAALFNNMALIKHHEEDK